MAAALVELDERPRLGTCAGVLTGLALLLFASSLFASSPLVAKVGSLAEGRAESGQHDRFLLSKRRLENLTDSKLEADAKLVDRAQMVGDAKLVESTLIGDVEDAKLVGDATAGSTIVVTTPWKDDPTGQEIVIEKGTAIEETIRVKMVTSQPSETNTSEMTSWITLDDKMKFAHGEGAPIEVHIISTIFKQSSASNPFSSAQKDLGTSMGFLDPSHLLAVSYTNLMMLLIFVVYGQLYKGAVVDQIAKVPPRHMGKEYGDFAFGLFDCARSFDMCAMSLFCAPVRMAHTNEVTGVCGFWQTLLCLWCSSWACGLGPFCLNFYFRLQIKEHMNVDDDLLTDCILAACCAPCVTGQQALSVDNAAGWDFGCPCRITRTQAYMDLSQVQELTHDSNPGFDWFN